MGIEAGIVEPVWFVIAAFDWRTCWTHGLTSRRAGETARTCEMWAPVTPRFSAKSICSSESSRTARARISCFGGEFRSVPECRGVAARIGGSSVPDGGGSCRSNIANLSPTLGRSRGSQSCARPSAPSSRNGGGRRVAVEFERLGQQTFSIGRRTDGAACRMQPFWQASGRHT